MKKLIFTFFLLGIIFTGYSQNTYYWVGGASGAWNTAANWNTQLGGSDVANARTTANIGDVLIFDGTNIGAGATGTVTPTALTTSTTQSFGQLILQNGAYLVLQRGTSPGTGTFTINGDGGASDDLQIDATSTLKITSPSSGYNFNVKLSKTAQATGAIFGTVIINDGGLGNARLIDSSGVVNGLVFKAGSKCYIYNTLASDYPFGNSPTSVSSSSYFANGILFDAGSTLFYQGGVSPFTQTSTNASPFSFAKGSTFQLEASIAGTNNIFSRHYFGNVTIGNNAVVNADGGFYNVDTLTVNTGATFNLSATSGYAVAGNVVNNGMLGSVVNSKSSQIIMLGTVPQTVSGTGSFNGICGFSVGTDATVTLNADLKIGSDTISSPTSFISGKLNMQARTLSSTGLLTAGNISVKAQATATSSGTVSGNVVTIDASKYAAGINTANVVIGNLVTGTNIPANTYIINTASDASQFTMSKAATGVCTSFTISNGSAVITTANAAGIDGSFATTGTKSFDAGVNYVFNAATTTPFASSVNNATGDVIFNAAATTNKSQSIGGVLTLANGNLTINNTDTLRLLGTASISGANSSRYIVTKASGATVGTLRIDSIAAAKVFPVGTVNNYLPVTITPSARDTFNVSVFEGLTLNGLPNGTAFNASQKASAIDAVWMINPKTNIGQTAAINLSWTNALTGSRFFTFTNAQIGVGRNDGASWLNTIASTANNTARNVTATYSAYGSFGIGEVNSLLPVQIVNFSATLSVNGSKLSWSAANEIGIEKYTIQSSSNGTSFTDIGVVNAVNNTTLVSNYSFTDATVLLATTYYRLKIISANGDIKYSNILVVKNTANVKISAFPNPVKNALTVSGLKGGEQILLYDNTGKNMVNKLVPISANSISINLEFLQKGVYMLKVVANDANTVTQVVLKD